MNSLDTPSSSGTPLYGSADRLRGHRLRINSASSSEASDDVAELDSITDSTVSFISSESGEHTLSSQSLATVELHAHRGATPDLMLRCVNRCGGDQEAALRAMLNTLVRWCESVCVCVLVSKYNPPPLSPAQAWREDHDIKNLLSQPQPCFRIIKDTYCHGVHCRARDGVTPVYIEHIGQFRNAYGALRKQGITDAQLLRHMLFVNEHLYGVTSKGCLPGGRVIKILDMSGASLGDIRGAAHRFSKEVRAGESGVVCYGSHMMVLVAQLYWQCVWFLFAHTHLFVQSSIPTLADHAHPPFSPSRSLATSTKPITWTDLLLHT